MVAASHAVLPIRPTENIRQDLAIVLLYIAIEHIASIRTLFEQKALASGYALMRPAVESAYKSIWIATVADEEQVRRAHVGRDVYGDFKAVIKDIEK